MPRTSVRSATPWISGSVVPGRTAASAASCAASTTS